MNYPNARKGFKKLFASEILQLLALILTTTSTVLIVLMTYFAENGDNLQTGLTGIGLVVSSIVSTILFITAMILNMVGVVQSSKDEPSFKVVIYVIIVGIAAAIAITVCDILITEGNMALSNFLQVVSDMVNAITTILIIQGISNIAERIDEKTVLKRGNFLFHLIICIALASIFMKAVVMCIPKNVAVEAEVILMLISEVLVIFQYFVYLSFLGKASKMLNNQ